MKISKIQLQNFRIYKGLNTLLFSTDSTDENIIVIAGKNGFGKTTLLTSLVWAFYGKLMAQVEDKYRRDIKNSGGYETFLQKLFNIQMAKNSDHGENSRNKEMFVEIELSNIIIPSIPCDKITIRRSFNLEKNEEVLTLLIDGIENELTKEVGYDVFINDFILPREIAKFFFFDAEKIVSLAEASTKAELRSLSKAYSEVLGIKKYEDLKKNLEGLLVKLKRNGAKGDEKKKIEILESKIEELKGLQEFNLDKQSSLVNERNKLQEESDKLQEKLIREGNNITVDELKDLKSRKEFLKKESDTIKISFKKMLDVVPLVLAGEKLFKLKEQLALEAQLKNEKVNGALFVKELENFKSNSLDDIRAVVGESKLMQQIEQIFESHSAKLEDKKQGKVKGDILLDFSDESVRTFNALYENIKTSFQDQFQKIVQSEKDNRILINRISSKIKQAEARKDNHLSKTFRDEKLRKDDRIKEIDNDKTELIEEAAVLQHELNNHLRKLSELTKTFQLVKTDQEKYIVTEELLAKVKNIILKIKEEKKYALQKAVAVGLKKMMHKNDFVSQVLVTIREEDLMTIDLIDEQGNIIDKNGLSKGEQQLYATALLKALVDESGINFPVFIDSPLQKFDKLHSENIIKEFYPDVSEQVVLFPLLEKELSEDEFQLLKPNVQETYLIHNSGEYNSGFVKVPKDELFKVFNQQEEDSYVQSN